MKGGGGGAAFSEAVLVLLKCSGIENVGEEEALKDLDEGGEEGDRAVAFAGVGWFVRLQERNNPACLPEWRDDGGPDDVIEEGGDVFDGNWS